ncbi:Type I phosphodiesterase/nucleotide pyrophosphatase/phosphate transferase [Macleaya cordata]|uniref:Type I phosphodiesterase/nucleotide pyrophosphatase/phosphate transferase n=1 Tax=Macleaya cordata TaxID=56857 RepID=A0A200PU88_MACCD|nr:Type I phosphodiesterase/nucleotide pyrophosphatase/phosphate transferase [Macleaya cordata]
MSSSSSSLTCARLATWTIVAVLLQILGLLLFVLGFFPVKPALSGVSGPESYRSPMSNSMEDHEHINQLSPYQRRSLYKEMSEIPPSFDRLILMVVDGLPAEFVLGKGDQPPTKAMMDAMPYTQSLLSHGTAIGYHAKAAPPTVTMPRLKAMVSGAIGGFLDVAFNFNTQAFLDDNLLGQFLNIGWKMVMLGDETWIKLFPGLFTRHDGVSSFYVKDTIEVDHNVSRHLGAELVANDWNLLILHYLGLDHVGHIGGRSSILMIPKLKEMDEVIKTIHMSSVLPQDPSHERTLLVVLSDHGMTENGNHGGSSYEETDSLALFIGLGSKIPDYASATRNAAFQVDIAPTLALLFGVPIPKNNIGVLMGETFDSLTDDQRLRALELNSWQLLRLLQAQLPGLLCGNFPCNGFNDAQCSEIDAHRVNIEKKFYCLFSKAATLHRSWVSQEGRSFCSTNTDDFRRTVAAYNEFLRTANEWLSRRATDKPPELLAPGIATMVVSCVTLLSILFRLCKEVYLREKQHLFGSDNCKYKWHLDEVFALVVIVILVFSMGSSSMVEEEQYIWHFLTSTLYLIFLRKAIQSPSAGATSSLLNVIKRQKFSYNSRACSIIFVLICGRVLRGWHQGGVNWVHLPDISKWLEQIDARIIKSIQIVSVFCVISLSSLALYLLKLKSRVVLVVQLSLFLSGLLVVMHIMEYHGQTFAPSNYSSTLIAQIFYAILGSTVMLTVLQAPWVLPISDGETHVNTESHSVTSFSINIQMNSPLLALRYSLYLIGWTYTVCWCLLQLLLQQPINAMPVLLLFFQILGTILYFSVGGTHDKQWVEVAALYFLGMAGHFGLGNSNTLATIDVAGAFIGISSHSTLLAGVVMFMITLASPLLFLLSMVIYISMKDASYLLFSHNGNIGHLLQMMIGFPCLVPLALNSVMLTAFTIVLVLMRNHLFVWSVFSPKYLYVCATTVCVYVGVLVVALTGIYTSSVFFFRKRMLSSMENGTSTKLKQ